MRTFSFLAGFAVGMGIFLLGLKIMSTALEDVVGFRLKMLLSRLTATKGRGCNRRIGQHLLSAEQ